VTVDSLGRFEFTGASSGPARVLLRGPAGDVATDWFVL
jgi:hypothetical protein